MNFARIFPVILFFIQMSRSNSVTICFTGTNSLGRIPHCFDPTSPENLIPLWNKQKRHMRLHTRFDNKLL